MKKTSRAKGPSKSRSLRSAGPAPHNGKAGKSGKPGASASAARSGKAGKTGKTGKTGKADKAAKQSRRNVLEPARSPGGRVIPAAARSAATARARAATGPRNQDGLATAEDAIEAALDKKALMPILLDVSDKASYTDFIAVLSGGNERQVEAIAESIELRMKARGRPLLGREGHGGGRWMLLDYGDVVVHVFFHPVREVYDIEGLWVDARRVPLKSVPPEAINFHPDALYALS